MRARRGLALGVCRHSYWFANSPVKVAPSGVVNLLHYEDAAGVSISALVARRSVAGAVLLAADEAPRTRQQIVDAAATHPAFATRPPVVFAADDPLAPSPRHAGRGRVYDCSETKRVLDWRPKYATIEAFFEQAARDAN